MAGSTRARAIALQTTPRLATFLFNYVQLGLVVAVAEALPKQSFNVLILVFFELGILADCFVRGGSMRVWIGLACASALGLLVPPLLLPANVAIFTSMAAAGLLAMSLKKIRSSTDALGKIKRRWRALGYLSAGLFSTWLVTVFVVALLAAVYISRVSERMDPPLPERFRLDAQRLGPYLVVMLHHLHYFAYAYIVVVLFHSKYDVPAAALGPLFYVGWIGYYLFIQATRHQRLLVVCGHVLAALSVFGMLLFESFTAVLLLWLLTGVGGGTIVLLREANTSDDVAVYERFKAWESFGHVLGLACLAAAVLFELPPLSFLVSGIAGLACAAGTALWAGESRTRIDEAEEVVGRSVAVAEEDARTRK